ncbi:hypothetical protein PSGK_18865 [Pseudomonas solani]|uniref:phage tail assembly protein T n=1 Tax=Pseudomonas solani TaxID=2731552 RepID=UPI0035BE8941
MSWVKYRELRGSFNTGMRVEAGFALIASMMMNFITKSDEYTPSDFMPHLQAPEPTVEEAMKAWG